MILKKAKLNELAKTLSKSEIKGFKHINSKNNSNPNYLILFDAIIKLPNARDSILAEKYNIKVTARLKNYLYNKLMEFLLSTRDKSFKELNLQKYLAKYTLLSERNLNYATDYLKNAENIIFDYDLFQNFQQLADIKLTQLGNEPYSKSLVVETNKILDELEQNLTYVQQQFLITKFTNQLFLLIKKNDFKKDTETLSSSFNELNNQFSNKMTPKHLKLRWLDSKFFYYHYHFDLKKCYKTLGETMELLKEPKVLELIQLDYLVSFFKNYSNLGIIQKLVEYDSFLEYFIKTLNLDKLKPEFLSHIKMDEFDSKSLEFTNSDKILETKKVEKFIVEVNESKQDLINWINVKPKFKRVANRLISFYLYINKPQESLFWINYVLEKKKNVNPNFYYYTLIRELIAHWKLGNFEYVANQILNVKKRLKNSDFNELYEQHLILMINDLNIASINNNPIRAILENNFEIFSVFIDGKWKHKKHIFNVQFWLKQEIDLLN